MKELTMLQMYKANLKNNKALFPTHFSFMQEYSQNYSKYDKLFARNRHFFYYKDIFADNSSSDDDVLEDFQFDVDALLTKNADSLQKVYDASLIEYQPLENYQMNESGTDKNSGTNTNTQSYGDINKVNQFGQDVVNNVFGVQEHTNVIGAQTNTNSLTKTGTDSVDIHESIDTDLGAITKTEKIGSVNNQDKSGSRTDTTTNSVAGYNVSDFSNSDKSDLKVGEQTNTHTENERTNTENTGAVSNRELTTGTNSTTYNTTDSVTEKLGTHTDTLTDSEHTDTQTRQSREDSESFTRGDDTQTQSTSGTTEHIFERHGNIGVTTSQQMLQSEIDLRLNFNFFDVLFDLIIKELCSFSDSGFDGFLTPFYNEILKGE